MAGSIKKNLSLQMIYQILTIIAPLITAPYVSRVLGAENVGRYSYSYSIVVYFVMVASLGINSYGSRLVAQNRNDSKLFSKLFSELVIIHTVVGFLALVAYIFFCLFFVKEDVDIFLVNTIYVLASMLGINWLFSGLERFEESVRKNIIIKIISIVSIFLFVKREEDLIIYVLILAVSNFTENTILWLQVRKHVSLKLVKIKDSIVHLKPLLVLFLPAIAILLYRYMDKIMLGNMDTKSAVGYYNSAERIITLSVSFINALGIVMLPRISNLIVEGNSEKIKDYYHKSIVIISLFSFACGAGAICVANDFIPIFYGKGYEPAIDVLIILSFSLPFSAIANVVKTQYLLPRKRDAFFAITVISGAVVNFIINFTLIPKLGVVGASIGTLVTEILVCVVQVFYSNKEMKTIKELVHMVGFLAVAVVMGIIISIFNFVNPPMIRLLLKIVVGAFSYAILALVYMWFVERKLLYSIIGSIKKRMCRKE